ncbi:phosphate regulon transcriptional regulator PhoB [Porticoccus litoralis]|uniref:Phosphate regulon transcriptional regulatory protein PhoB n=1 Tax=Porticoccus litoralis TaxID=434086 RepID=A0AAW8B2T0_9GAMM|nr:phosphate regulon transcriptional regulator PhoB [Porticoccus litoralis]MDP1520712.1 phosphate regulon transcriptional regulator PhoB [Porticoccus litoralis]
MSEKTILIVDDEPAIRDMISTALDVAGFNCIQAENAQQAHAMIIDEQPDLVLLDWMMPGTSGVELIRRLQRDELTKNVPVIMLTAKASEDNVVQGLEIGADDYITKPFSPRALVARINAVLRRAEPALPQEPIQVESLLFDPISHRVTINDQTVSMGPTEFRLLSFFLTHQERVYSRDQILDHVWGGNVYMDERTVDVHIRRLRKAIALEGHDRFIQTVRGAGYRFSTRVVEE